MSTLPPVMIATVGISARTLPEVMAANDRNEDRAGLRELLQDFKSKRALAENHERVIVWRNEDVVFGVFRELQCPCFRFVVVRTFEMQINAVTPDRLDLRFWGRPGN